MNIAIEKNNKIRFFRINGKNLNKFITEAVKANKGLDSIWSYTHIERTTGSTIGMYKNVKIISL